MPPKDPKKSIRSHKTWVTNAVGRAEEFLGEHPDGLVNPRNVKDAEELIEEIKEKLSSMEKKWTDVLSPQLEADEYLIEGGGARPPLIHQKVYSTKAK